MSDLKIELRECDTTSNKNKVHFDLISHRYVIANESYVSDDIYVGQNTFRNSSY